jgi:FAD/FMN-containing dehydrogenase
LRARVSGAVITPGDAGYDEARRVYNAMIDRRPAVIVRCGNAADVRAAVDFARENGLALAVRGGGHSVPGFGTVDDGVVADLSGMRAVTVDPAKRTARAEGGATWGDFNEATAAFGLATTGGIISTTGVAGLTLGGGIGYLARGFGLSCDNLISAEIVTADGKMVTASEDEHADLFWAIRGGGGNFGVATALEFRLHPVKEIYGGPMFFAMKDAEAVLRYYREFIAEAPEQFGGFPAFQIAPPLPFIPVERHGETFLAFIACWAGPVDEGEQILKPLHDVAEVVAEHVGPMPYPALNSTVHIYPINGACHRVAADATAFAYRDATFAPVIAGMWPDPAQNDANIKWVRDYYTATAPLSEEGGYINFMAGDDQDRIKANYRGNYPRLVDVKRRYDADNLFRVNQNIKP